MLVGIRMFNPNFWYICHESYHDYLSKAQSDAMPKYWSSGSAWLALLIFGEGSEGIEDVADPIDAAQASRHTETLEHMEFQLFGSPLALGGWYWYQFYPRKSSCNAFAAHWREVFCAPAVEGPEGLLVIKKNMKVC